MGICHIFSCWGQYIKPKFCSIICLSITTVVFTFVTISTAIWMYIGIFNYGKLNYIKNIKSVALSSQGSHTGQLDFWNRLAYYTTTE